MLSALDKQARWPGWFPLPDVVEGRKQYGSSLAGATKRLISCRKLVAHKPPSRHRLPSWMGKQKFL